MDLALYFRVLSRFRWLVLGGSLLACVLAALAVLRITSNGVSYRYHEVWQSQSTVLLTTAGFPWGKEGFSDPGISSLTDLYSQFANSDDVKAIMRKHGAPKSWKITASPLQPTTAGGDLPAIALLGTAYTPIDALKATVLGRQAFLSFVSSEQQAAGIPVGRRIELEVLQNAALPVLVQPRKKTLPIIVFLAVMTATIGLAFVLENLRPQPVTSAARTDSTFRNPISATRKRIA